MNFSCEKYHKKQYMHAEYLSPEQIENMDDMTFMQSGEIWNLGVILYLLYQGKFPFQGNNDEEIILAILSK